ncbi:MAG: hypothetical protein WCP20_12460 [Desulfuromonadales bacterium]
MVTGPASFGSRQEEKYSSAGTSNPHTLQGRSGQSPVQWQRIILPALRKIMPDAQIIAVTHSPQVLSCISPESVLLISREKDGLKVSSPEDSFGLDSNRILEDLMNVSERPAEMKQRFDELFTLIDNNQLEPARKLIAELKEVIHADPDLVKAETIIRRKEILGK